MIECPVCHVQNNDMSRFCLECGQRLGPATGPTPNSITPAPAAPPANPPVTGTPAAPPVSKLRSPLLSGEEFLDEAADYVSGQQSGNRASGSRPLRSPLLGVSAADDAAYSSGSQHKPKGGLRSPLLGDTGDAEEPLPRAGGGLHSPLLGSDSAPARTAYPGDSASHHRPGHLHSPLLGDTDDDYDEPGFTDEDDPNVLRSPLLAAKLPQADKAPAIPKTTPAATADQLQAPNPQPPVAALGSQTPPVSGPSFPNWPAKPPGKSPFAGARSLTEPQPALEPASSPNAAPTLRPAKRSSFKALEDNSYDTGEDSAAWTGGNRPQASGLPGFIKLLVVPLGLALAGKLWYFTQFQPELPFVVDQSAQILTITCILIMCWSTTGQKS